ncbi:MAG: radical SAM family heme chaperone HemW [Sphingobacteriales bacterium]|nr:radical SAM family heme chaperone HemW [Sphingobacteriales bacterium]
MSGIYIHIPFCKQACHYCNFHFATSLRHKDALIDAIVAEIALQRGFFERMPTQGGKANQSNTQEITTIYLGGGTPSLLSTDELTRILEVVYRHFKVAEQPEISLEANPDDLTHTYLTELRQTPVNRLSIGIQSLFDEDLRLMNRAHNAQQARRCVADARQAGFEWLTIDLIYGIGSEASDSRWQYNLDTALSWQIPHFSAYCLTVEPKTPLAKQVAAGIVRPLSDEKAATQFEYLMTQSAAAGYWQYEISNFCLPHQYSRHNTAYWQGKPYLGIGPSAHSFDGTTRYWNVANNAQYIRAITEQQIASNSETLSTQQHYNEYVMTALRTMWGIDLTWVAARFGEAYSRHLLREAQRFIRHQHLLQQDKHLLLTSAGKFVADGIASNLMWVD